MILIVLGLAIGLVVPASGYAQVIENPIVPLTDPLAPFLESRAFALSKGATAEFNKMEWVAIDPISNKMYISMSDVTKAMADDEGDIKLKENRCGIVYVADLDKDFNTKALKPLIEGGPYNKDAKGDKCDVNNISNPDGLFVDANGTLWISEDTSNHVNNAVWKWDGKKLTRFATVPRGAEVTGFFVSENGTMFFSSQHPSGKNQYPYNRGVVGVITGFNSKDDFEELAVPAGDDQHMVKLAKGDFQVILRVGEQIPDDIYGQRYGQVNTVDGKLQLVCNHPDGNVFIPTTSSGNEGYLYTNFECRPGAVSKIYIRKSAVGAKWQVLEGENVDFSAVNGTWNNCGSSLTPWNTALTSEEYEPFATQEDYKKNVSMMSKYLGTQANPYDYGYLVEMMPDPYGENASSVVVKHYALGRFSHEMAMVAPDQKTVYHGDDGANVVLFKSILAEPGDMSTATLYAAKITQNADGSLAIEWIELGTGNNDEIAEAISSMEMK